MIGALARVRGTVPPVLRVCRPVEGRCSEPVYHGASARRRPVPSRHDHTVVPSDAPSVVSAQALARRPDSRALTVRGAARALPAPLRTGPGAAAQGVRPRTGRVPDDPEDG